MKYYSINSDNLKKYTKAQFDLFYLKTGFRIAEPLSNTYLDTLGNDIDGWLKIYQKEEFVGEKALNKVDGCIEKINEHLIKSTLLQPNPNIPIPMNDKQFATLMETFFDTMNNITMAYKKEHEISTDLAPSNITASLNRIQIEDVYKRAVGVIDDNYNNAYKTKFSKIKKGKSAAMVTDMDSLLKRDLKNEDNVQRIAAVYRNLKAKQKKNSIFTNWFSKKGYQERAAMKRCEEALANIVQSTNKNDFAEKIETLANKQVDNSCTRFVGMRKGTVQGPDKNFGLERYDKYLNIPDEEKDKYLNDLSNNVEPVFDVEKQTGLIEVKELNEPVQGEQQHQEEISTEIVNENIKDDIFI